MELDWLKKKVGDQPLNERQSWIEPDASVPISTQCKLLKVTRSVIYEQKKRLQKETDKGERVLLRLLDEEYTRHPFYGSRRMKKYLGECGYSVSTKFIRTYCVAWTLFGPTRCGALISPIFSCPRGFVYLVAIIDWYSRKVLSWRLSNTMDAGFCVDCLEEAITLYDTPAIFNFDQGSHFTSDAFTGVLLNYGITISMDGRGRALDNIFVERLWRTQPVHLIPY